ncbi:MAG TPA: DUF899 family protein [Phenylobacterium sp.]|jgi:predicted dithiol-disulfide oxidoreductase (DUF899 family)|nr:DUF899 family protein [Phenylobacterium sp.]
MDAKTPTLTPVDDLVARNEMRFPNESAEYRAARTALLKEEYELRRRLERVAALRRTLPPGGEVRGDYRFMGENGPSDFAGLFGDKDTLILYSFMFGPGRERPCPMCTNLLGPLDANARDLEQKVALGVIARSPVERLVAFKQERGWQALKVYQDLNDAYSRDYFALTPKGSEEPAINVFTRQGGAIRHFWSGEMGESDPGQDPRGAPDPAPLWNFLDMTPKGRDADWYPSLTY